MQLRTEEIDQAVENSLILTLGTEGHSVYLRNPATKECRPLIDACGLTREEAEALCRLLRWYAAAVVSAVLGGAL